MQQTPPLTFMAFTSKPKHGTITQLIGLPNKFIYTPDVSYHGNDSFTYKIRDPQLGTSIGTVLIEVNGFRVVPDKYFTGLNQTLQVGPAEGVLKNDKNPNGGPLTAHLNGIPQNGGKVTLLPSGAFTYFPPVGFTGQDIFSYYLTNAAGVINTHANMVTISVI